MSVEWGDAQWRDGSTSRPMLVIAPEPKPRPVATSASRLRLVATALFFAILFAAGQDGPSNRDNVAVFLVLLALIPVIAFTAVVDP